LLAKFFERLVRLKDLYYSSRFEEQLGSRHKDLWRPPVDDTGSEFCKQQIIGVKIVDRVSELGETATLQTMQNAP